MRASDTSCSRSSVRVHRRVTPGAVLLVVLKVGKTPLPFSMRITVAMIAAIRQCAHGYSGWTGATIIGTHSGSRSVAALSSRSPLRMAGIRLHNWEWYLGPKTGISPSLMPAGTGALEPALRRPIPPDRDADTDP